MTKKRKTKRASDTEVTCATCGWLRTRREDRPTLCADPECDGFNNKACLGKGECDFEYHHWKAKP